MRASVRVVVGGLVLGVVVATVGAGAVLDGVRALDARALAAGVLLGAVSTVACATRWRLVAGELGVPLGLRGAVTACYRAQLLNTVLPAGVLGDVDRGLAHARATGRTAPALRAVVWERVAGQVVQAVVVVVVLVLVPSPLRGVVPAALALPAAACVVGLVLARAPQVRRVWPGVVLASTVALAAHVTTYVLAARATGSAAPLTTLVPLALVVLVAAGVPLNVAGWGPREGVAAWASAVAGLGAAAGLSTAVAFGTMVLVANLPGVLVLAAGRAAGVDRVAAAPVGGGSRGA